MKQTAVRILIFLATAIVAPAHGASANFASLRKEADDFAAKEKPGFKLLKVALTRRRVLAARALRGASWSMSI
jgi:hypothetical protein